MIILGRTGVVGLGRTGFDTGSSSSSPSGPSSSITVGTPFVAVRDRVALVVDFEGPAFALVVRVDVEGLVEGGLVEGGLVEGGFFDGGFVLTASSWTSAGRTPGGLPRRLGATVGSTSIVGSASTAATAVFLVVRFGGAFSVLDGPATVLDRVALGSDFFSLGFGGPEISGSCFAFAARRVVRGFGGGFAGVTGPSDRSLRREGSDGRGSAGAFRLGGIVGQPVVKPKFCGGR